MAEVRVGAVGHAACYYLLRLDPWSGMPILRASFLVLFAAACGAPRAYPDAAPCDEWDYCEDEAIDLAPEDPEVIQQAGKADSVFGSWPAVAQLPEACGAPRPFTAFFTPDDPAVTLELGWIDRVRAARKADGGDYAEGQNPFRIRYAVYNLSHRGIQEALVQAEEDGVDVQVLIEADQLDKPWSSTAGTFERGGLEVAKDYRSLDDAAKQSADLVGIKEKGLMHLKMRLFEPPDETALLSGSYNPNQSAGANEENFNLLRDAAVIARYAAAYDAVLHDEPLVNEWDDGAAVNVLFTPEGEGERAAKRILDWLEEEEELILLMVFSLRNVTAPGPRRSLIGILADKVEAGVPVYVITDRKQADGIDATGQQVYRDDWTDDRLRDAGVPVYEAINEAADFFGGVPYPYAAMHHKAAILGTTRMRVITDASNWTVSGLGSWKYTARNVESVLFVDSAKLDDNETGRRYLGQWLKVLDRYGPQSVEQDGQLPPSEVVDRLLGLTGWVTSPVGFAAFAETSMGENIFAVGGHEVLGSWGQSGHGVPLTTTAETYPAWASEATVDVPLGTRLEWKLTARKGDEVRWEGGDNRVGLASPAVCSASALLTGSWR